MSTGEAGDSGYNHFLFTTFAEQGVDALVLAEIHDSSFELQEVARAEHFGFPLCVRDGRAYFKHLSRFFCIDLKTGQRSDLPLLNPYDVTCCFADDRLYSAIRQGGVLTIRIHDFQTRAYRDVKVVHTAFLPLPNAEVLRHRFVDAGASAEEPGVHDKHRPDSIAVSPDHTRLAFFDAVEPAFIGGFRLAVVDLARAITTYVGPIVDYNEHSSSKHVSYPPYVWLDSDHVLLAHKVPKPEGGIGPTLISTFGLLTGSLRDVAESPSRAPTDYARLTCCCDDGPVYTETAAGRFRVDVESNTLVEDDSVGAGFAFARRQRGTEVHYDGRLIERMEEYDPTGGGWRRIDCVTVSPDGNRACMVVHDQCNWLGPGLRLYDVAQGEVRVVPRGSLQNHPMAESGGGEKRGWVLWVADEDLEPVADPPEPPEGWTPF
ncbi:MAG: hypothetical protein GY851_13595 [bacterium]|nr:hypothetical protein [bacterium]